MIENSLSKVVSKIHINGMMSKQVQTVGEKYNSTEWVTTTFDTPAGRKNVFVSLPFVCFIAFR